MNEEWIHKAQETQTRLGRLLTSSLLLIGCSGFATVVLHAQGDAVSKPSYEQTWRSLRTYPVPQWLRDGKFGIYTHWGIYAVPAMGPNATWYSHNLYFNPY